MLHKKSTSSIAQFTLAYHPYRAGSPVLFYVTDVHVATHSATTSVAHPSNKRTVLQRIKNPFASREQTATVVTYTSLECTGRRTPAPPYNIHLPRLPITRLVRGDESVPLPRELIVRLLHSILPERLRRLHLGLFADVLRR